MRGGKEKSYCKIETIVFLGGWKFLYFSFIKEGERKKGNKYYSPTFFGNFFTCRHKPLRLNHLWSPSSFSHVWRVKGPSPSKDSLTTVLKRRGGQESHIWLVSIPWVIQMTLSWDCHSPLIQVRGSTIQVREWKLDSSLIIFPPMTFPYDSLVYMQLLRTRFPF